MSTTSKSPDTNPADITSWHPISLIRPPSNNAGQLPQKPGFALIVLNQPLPHHLVVTKRLWENARTHIAADGGANCLFDAAGQHDERSFDNLQTIIGDLDSLTDETRKYFTSAPCNAEVIHDPDQESTDFGKAVKLVRDQRHVDGPVDIVAIGGLGGRVDQGLSQLHHLYLFQAHPRYAEGRMYLFSGESLTFLLKAGRHRIRVREEGEAEDLFDKYVGVLPVKGPSRISTKGLEWDVTDWETEFGGRVSTSNHILPETKVVEVETTEDVLFTIALRRL